MNLDHGRVDAEVARMLDAWGLPGAAVAIVDARSGPQLLAGYGVRAVDGTDKIDADTVFNVASLTKAFAATAAAAAVDAGLLEWDTPLIEHLPYLRLYDPYVTAVASLRDALCHRIGIDQHYHNGLALTSEEMIRELRHDVPLVPFRSQHLYHNIMFAAAGEAVAASAGVGWHDHLRESLLAPLGLASSSSTAAELAAAPNVACSHLRDRSGTLHVDPFRPDGWWSMDNHAPAGAVNSTASDMARWMQFLLGDGTWEGSRVVSATALAETLAAQATHRDTYYGPFPALAYALGWEVTSYEGRLLRWHMGTFRGVVSVVILSPADGVGVFVAVNSRDADDGMAHVGLAHWILDHALGLPEQDRLADPLAERDRLVAERRSEEATLLAAYTQRRPRRAEPAVLCGDYAHPTEGRYRVRLGDSALRIERLGCREPYEARLEHLDLDAYQAHWDETVIDYEPAQVVSFTSNGGPAPRSLLLHRRGDDDPTECMRDA